jgi:hypothetical protein
MRTRDQVHESDLRYVLVVRVSTTVDRFSHISCRYSAVLADIAKSHYHAYRADIICTVSHTLTILRSSTGLVRVSELFYSIRGSDKNILPRVIAYLCMCIYR